MRSFSFQVLVILTTFGGLCSVIAKSVSQGTSSKDEASCEFEETAHPVNSTFISTDCSVCYCEIEMGWTKVSCIPTCPSSPVKCPPGSTMEEKEHPVNAGGSRCICRRKFCIPKKVSKPQFCYFGGRRFRRGRVFITKDCTLKCRCKKNGKTRCTPLCKKKPDPECGPDETLKNVTELSARGRCACETKKCMPNFGTVSGTVPNRIPR
ncbi:uncharacterized protein LOC111322421 isoform X2 [Stylophora pistillata]|uniref:uncharacterized protein LOC111322421 isoform X2 n=1 Tax=Stylophora pistillata TaxID=50429 RepID=UPI000C047D7E|nr:uncharacterized protein LOC111322421 isoform X2 [Stylophora pistillata]